MPAGLPPTPWLQGADPAAHYMQAYQAGAQISEANARMQQQAQQTSVELEMRQREHQQQSLMEQQRMEIEKQYHQSQMAMQQQKLDQAAQVTAIKTQAAAKQLQGEGLVKQYIEQHPEMPVEQSSLRARMLYSEYFNHSAAGLGSMGSALQRMNAPAPQSLAEKTDMGLDADTYKKLEAAKLKLQEQMGTASAKIAPQLQAQITELTRQQNTIRQNRGLTRPQVPPGVAQAPGQPAVGGAPVIAGRFVNGKLVMNPKPGEGHVTIGGQADQPDSSSAPSGPPPAGLSIGGVSLGGAAAPDASQPQASVPDSVQGPASAPAKEDDVLSEWRSGKISKTEAIKAIGRHITGPEWVDQKKNPSWHWGMQKDSSGEMTHTYTD